ncbi:sialate O-acetylesterase [Steroidobacter sp.]|uniref:sialate O-acetylesterase n=1 Tax=Steroidobacter sp. TaxID=1978227 RepID=UPI001A5BB36A|nr:sialate O-acetylesterase [Steroidobacter sp.]MBL8270768.1 beta galactosidase jelly roll domain-containing protein [Steroidobacter sp.]
MNARVGILCHALSLGALLAGSAVSAAPLLHDLFQDHAVLQRDQTINVWGQAQPGESLTLTLASARGQARADASGYWRASLPSLSAGGPYRLSVTAASGDEQTIDDVMIGDVWLCSGQSNMVLQVHRALDSRSEILNSANDSIRMLTVPMSANATPQSTFASPVQWLKASPSTVPEFSAVCLFFARELQKKDNVAMGLIASAWGGSKIQAWMSDAALRSIGGYDAALDALAQSGKDPIAAAAQWGAIWETWWRERTNERRGTEPWSAKPTGNWQIAPMEKGYWEAWGVPELASYDGLLWYRTNVTLTKSQAAQQATITIGRADESDQVWVNGRLVGAAGPGSEKSYSLPPKLLRAGDNSIVISVLDTYANGGLPSPIDSRALKFADGSSVVLNKEWRYRLPPANAAFPPRAPWEATAGLGVIHNGMIAPLSNLSLRGVAWYQGESNTDEADRYQPLLTRFMADWRARFRADLPFFIVQLAGYGPASTQPNESSWAKLREAQRLAVKADGNAGLAVAVDLGERTDVHPANKQEVARRLARAARHVLYNDAASASGPVPASARREAGGISVEFTDVTGQLVAYSAARPIGFETCAADMNTCQYAEATIQGSRVVLKSANANIATRVRYCWADSPVCTLYDEARLPAGPFQIELQ